MPQLLLIEVESRTELPKLVRCQHLDRTELLACGGGRFCILHLNITSERDSLGLIHS